MTSIKDIHYICTWEWTGVRIVLYNVYFGVEVLRISYLWIQTIQLQYYRVLSMPIIQVNMNRFKESYHYSVYGSWRTLNQMRKISAWFTYISKDTLMTPQIYSCLGPQFNMCIRSCWRASSLSSSSLSSEVITPSPSFFFSGTGQAWIDMKVTGAGSSYVLSTSNGTVLSNNIIFPLFDQSAGYDPNDVSNCRVGGVIMTYKTSNELQ